MGTKRRECCTLAPLFFFHYKKAEASEKHLVKADQQPPVGPCSRRLKCLVEQKEEESGVPEKDALTFPLWLQHAAETPVCRRTSDAAAELGECEDRKVTQKPSNGWGKKISTVDKMLGMT